MTQGHDQVKSWAHLLIISPGLSLWTSPSFVSLMEPNNNISMGNMTHSWWPRHSWSHVSQAPLNPLPHEALTFGFLYLSLHHPILAKVLQGLVSQNLPLWYLVTLNIRSGFSSLSSIPQWGLITWLDFRKTLWGQFSQNAPHLLLVFSHPLAPPKLESPCLSVLYLALNPVLDWSLFPLLQ